MRSQITLNGFRDLLTVWMRLAVQNHIRSEPQIFKRTLLSGMSHDLRHNSLEKPTGEQWIGPRKTRGLGPNPYFLYSVGDKLLTMRNSIGGKPTKSLTPWLRRTLSTVLYCSRYINLRMDAGVSLRM